MSAEPVPTRVRFYDRQFLQAEDLRAEQSYHLQMRWRHNLAQHSWGIVAGLELRLDGLGEQARLVIDRGMALDGYGRELVLAHAEAKRLADYNKETSYDVWLDYRLLAPPAAARAN